MIQSDCAFLICARLADKLVGFSYFINSKSVSFYASAVYLDHKNGASPATIWKAINYSRDIGLTSIDIGQQNYFSINEKLIDNKLANISFFKRGFGGFDQIFIDICRTIS